MNKDARILTMLASIHSQMLLGLFSMVIDENTPMNALFESQMWREAFQSVADDVDRLSRDVGKKVADDPLASIGMVVNPAPKGKGAEKSLGATSSAAKGRRKEEHRKEAVAAAAAQDPFARRRTRPKSYWAVGNDLDSASEVCSAGLKCLFVCFVFDPTFSGKAPRYGRTGPLRFDQTAVSLTTNCVPW